MAFDPHLVAAQLALGEVDSAALVRYAADAIESGIFGVSTIRLAALTGEPFDHHDVERFRDGFVLEAGIEHFAPQTAAVLLATRYARESLAGENLRGNLQRLERLYYIGEYPESLHPVSSLAEDVWSAEAAKQTPEQIDRWLRAALIDFLNSASV